NYVMARKALDAERFPLAKKHIDRTLAIWPGSIRTRLLAARIARRSGNRQESLDHLKTCERLLTRKEDDLAAEVRLEHLLQAAQSGEFEGVEKELWDRARGDDPRRAEILEALARGYMLSGQVREALGCLDPYLEERPGSARALTWRAVALERIGDREGALADYRRACEADPEADEPR